jgi:hypothetical protein
MKNPTPQDQALPAPPKDVAQIPDAATRVRAAVEAATRVQHLDKEYRDIRDAGLRELRAAGHTLAAIQAETGVNVHTVKAIVR